MFDIGFTELMVLAVVALVVVGPERLPKVARTVGHLMGRFQRYVSDVKSDIDRELRLDEMKKLREEVESQARKLQSQANDVGARVSSEMHEVQGDLAKPAEDIAKLMQESAPSLASLETPRAAAPSGSASVPSSTSDTLDDKPGNTSADAPKSGKDV